MDLPKPFLFSRCCFRSRIDRNLGAVLSPSFESDNAVYLCKQSVISADAHVGSRMNMSAALSVKDVAGKNKLTVRSLCAEALGLGITAVLRGTDAFLVRVQLKVPFLCACS